MTRQQIADVITACASRAEITKRLSPHSLCHTYATQLLDQGVALRGVQVFLGHASPTTTQRYDLGRDQLDRSPPTRCRASLVRAPGNRGDAIGERRVNAGRGTDPH